MQKTRLFRTVVVLALLGGVALAGFASGTQEPAGGTAAGSAAGRTGAWVDEVVFLEEANTPAGITRLQAGELDIYMDVLDNVDDVTRVDGDPELKSIPSYGNYNEITFNPAGPIFEGTGALNPFAVPRIREAMNWLIDREYISEEIYGGLAVPRYTTVSSSVPDYSRFIDVTRAIELQYAYDMERADRVITEEMQKLGASKVNGTWQYEGEDLVLIGLIRTEDARRIIGDYVSNQLEEIGFTVQREYKTSAEASPIWIQGNPDDGEFHFYTGGWVTTAISRDEGGNFDFFYTPRGLAFPLWQAYEPTEEFNQIAQRLGNNDFASLAERAELFARALELSMEDSVRIFLVTQVGAAPLSADLSVAADLSGSIYGAWLWPYTLRRGDDVGGSVTIGLPAMLPEPWNPIAGSNWIYDQMMIRATSLRGAMPDPYTGLFRPQTIQRAEVTALTGTPIGTTFDWVSLEFASEIEVPADAWVDWNASAETFVSVGEKHPNGLTAKSKIVLVYEDELLERLWHDGSTLSVADMVMRMITNFDLGDPESAIYDEAQAPSTENFKTTFRGFRITDTDPVTIEYYTDVTNLDAENLAAVANDNLMPFWAYGPGGWHALALGVRAEADGRLAFSTGKADELEVEWINYIAGPSLEILEEELEGALGETYIPYEPTLGEFITASEARTRYRNLQAWYEDKGHFWVGLGPMYLEEAFPVEKSLLLRRFADFADPADRWSGFGEPPLATVEVSGPGRVAGGSAARFTVNVTQPDGTAYAADDIDSVKYLLFNSAGELVKVGDAAGGSGGAWTVSLTAADTSGLGAGSSRLEIAVAPIPVVIPSFDAIDFTTTQ